ncbi:hypothetical protein [Methylobacterium sp. Leaf91]|nr:hypothetical protein [Methylobacterium sp. Leaf91]
MILRFLCVLLALLSGCSAWNATIHAAEIDRFIRTGGDAPVEQP